MTTVSLDDFPRDIPLVRICRIDSPLVPKFLIECDLDSHIEKRIAIDGIWEKNTLWLALSSLKTGDIVIDIGANIGAYTVPLAMAVGETGMVLAFEPVPHLAERMRRNLALNRVTSAKIISKAVSNQSGRATFYTPKSGNFGLGSLHFNKDFPDPDILDVEVVTLDGILPTLLTSDQKISLIKLDIQGTELAAIQGAVEILNKHRPQILLEFESEYHTAPVEVATELSNFLSGIGYGLFSPSFPFLVGFDPTKYYNGELVALPII